MLRLLGPARVVGTSGRALSRTAFVAAAIIDLAPGRQINRADLAARLWEDADAGRAAGNLRQMLAVVRQWEKASATPVFGISGSIVFRDDHMVNSDLRLFGMSDHPDTPARLRLLLELYAGDFLADSEPSGEQLSQWVRSRRVELRERFVSTALSGARTVGGIVGQEALRRLSTEAPYDDSVAREAMVAALHGGEPQVLKVFGDFAQRMEQDLGTQPEPRTVALLRELAPNGASESAGELHRAPVSVPHIPRVLILPPTEHLSLAPQDAILVDAMIDEVTHALSRARTFAVFAPHSARQLIRTPFPNGNPYGADYLVRTSLIAVDTVSASLRVGVVNLSSHELLLSEEIRIGGAELNSDHVRLATALCSRLAHGIERAERRLYHTTGSASAYVQFLLGCDDIKTIELKSLRRAKAHFRQAMRLSPDFVPPRAMFARSCCLEWLLLDRSELGPIKIALGLAQEAVDIDPTDPLAHREVGHALLYLDRLDEGIEALKSATDFGPHHADILLNYADGLIHIGETAEARRVMDRALALNPLPPDQYHWISATADYLLGNYPAASASFAKMKEREAAARFIAAVEAMNGNIEEAHRQRDLFLASHPDFQLADYMVPQRKPEDREHYLEGLRRAGFR